METVVMPSPCPPGPAGWAAAHRYYGCWLFAARWLARDPVDWRRTYALHRFVLPHARRALTRLLAAEGWTPEERRALAVSLRTTAWRNRHLPVIPSPDAVRKVNDALAMLRVPDALLDPDADRGMPLPG